MIDTVDCGILVYHDP